MLCICKMYISFILILINYSFISSKKKKKNKRLPSLWKCFEYILFDNERINIIL